MVEDRRSSLAKCFLIPQRYILGIMGFLAVVNAYTMRVSLSVALTVMAPDPEKETKFARAANVDPSEQYDWSSSIQGHIKGAFFYGYVLTHLPGGVLAEKFGGKYTLGLGILSTSIFTLLTPLVVYYGDYPWLIALRVLEGLGEGTTYPALNALLSRWVPLAERAKIGTLVYAGGQIGTIVGTGASGFIIEATGTWTSVFYLFGALGVVWFICWQLLCYSDPESHPFISEKERDYLRKEIHVSNEPRSIPWLSILTSAPLWALVAAQIGHDWGFFTMVTDLPKYMDEIFSSPVSENGLFSSLPYVFMWIVSMSSGWLCDYLIVHGHMTITFARKFFTAIAAITPGLFIVGAGYAGTDQVTVLVLFCIGMGFMGTFYCGMKVNALDLSPNNAGTLMAIVNGIGAITGIITPIIDAQLVTSKKGAEEQWRLVFWISYVVFSVTTVIYLLWASGEVQPWDDPNYKKNKAHTNGTVENGIVSRKSSVGSNENVIKYEPEKDNESVPSRKESMESVPSRKESKETVPSRKESDSHYSQKSNNSGRS